MVRPARDPDAGRLSNDGRIDPASVDMAEKKRRKPKVRDRPDPPQELRSWSTAAEKRAYARPYPPNIMLEPVGFDEEHWTSPHNDVELWGLQLADAFGTRSRSVCNTFLLQLEALCGKDNWDEDAHQWRLNEHEFSAMLAVINSLKPKNELEAAHAAQMVAVHLLTMKVSARAIRYDYDTKTAAVASKLARTFTIQREAFERLRKPNRTAKQSIKVSRETHHHQHIHVHRGANENDGQPHGPAAAIVDQRVALPGPDETRHELPLSSNEGKAGVPRSRGQESRRTNGAGKRQLETRGRNEGSCRPSPTGANLARDA